jgi:hypothetical protein
LEADPAPEVVPVDESIQKKMDAIAQTWKKARKTA